MRNNLIVIIPFLPENLSKKMRIFPAKMGSGLSLLMTCGPGQNWITCPLRISHFANF